MDFKTYNRNYHGVPMCVTRHPSKLLWGVQLIEEPRISFQIVKDPKKSRHVWFKLFPFGIEKTLIHMSYYENMNPDWWHPPFFGHFYEGLSIISIGYIMWISGEREWIDIKYIILKRIHSDVNWDYRKEKEEEIARLKEE